MSERVLDWSWRHLPAVQQPTWPVPEVAEQATATLKSLPGIVDIQECDQLRREVAAAADGRALVLQAGDCAERFDTSPESTSATVRVITRIAHVLSRGVGLPVVVIGRMAGQFAKPRSGATEERDGVELPVYRGDVINSPEFTLAARIPDPRRMLTAHRAAVAKLGLVRSLNREMFVSHEALLLDYESALVRWDEPSGRWFSASGHLLWIGERTRDPLGAHVAFIAQLANPIGVKIGPTCTVDEVLSVIDRIDPAGEPGRLTLVARMGADRIRTALPPLLRAVVRSGRHVAWMCDPMHGNTIKLGAGRKTRRFEDIAAEVARFHETLGEHGVAPSGLHLELTGEDVTECIGRSPALSERDLARRYETACDPRLNRLQAIRLVHLTTRTFRKPASRPALISEGVLS
ncbi:3-deoxy-7-phosphoheptulonate synthase [Lentzea alba]|uniref:3-deoxy-7-phosphoheptulonate synthase n=1 Tax=Lentzea alba TaxID=2714351 RepID=UPI0039BF9765